MKMLFKISILLICYAMPVYSLNIIEQLTLPPNKLYLQSINISFDRIKNSYITDKFQNQQNLTKDKDNRKNRIKLTGIIKSNKKLYAIINGDTYSKGDKIQNYILQDIEINKITLKKPGRKNEKITILLEN